MISVRFARLTNLKHSHRGSVGCSATQQGWTDCAGPGAVQSVVQSIKDHRDISIDFTVARPDGIQHVEVLPDIGADGKGKIGVQLQGNVEVERRKVTSPAELLQRSSEEIWRLLTATSNGLAAMVKNFDQAKDSVSSPVAVVAVGSQVARESPTGVLHWTTARSMQAPYNSIAKSLCAKSLCQHLNMPFLQTSKLMAEAGCVCMPRKSLQPQLVRIAHVWAGTRGMR